MARLWLDRFARLSSEEIKRYQLRRIRALLKRAYQRTAFYHRRLKEAGVKPDEIRTLDDLRKIPPATKKDFDSSQKANPPFGLHLAVPIEEVVRMCVSTGPGGPIFEPFTSRDVRMSSEAAAFMCKVVGVGPGDIAVVTSNFSYVPGGLLHQGIFEAVGCCTIPAGVGDSRKLVEVMRSARVSVLSAFTSYCFRIAQQAAEMGLDVRKDLALRMLIIGGEPGGGVPSIRKRLRETFGDLGIYEYYGTAENLRIGFECMMNEGFHVIEPFNYIEVVDMETNEPVAPGEKGVVVATNLHREALPVIRFRTDDISALIEEPCGCSLGFRRLGRILGKAGGIVRVKGVLVYPEPVEEVIASFPSLGQHQMVVTKDGDMDVLTVRVECLQPDLGLAQLLMEKLRAVLSVTPQVEFLAKGELPEDARFSRIVDRRSTY